MIITFSIFFVRFKLWEITLDRPNLYPSFYVLGEKGRSQGPDWSPLPFGSVSLKGRKISHYLRAGNINLITRAGNINLITSIAL